MTKFPLILAHYFGYKMRTKMAKISGKIAKNGHVGFGFTDHGIWLFAAFSWSGALMLVFLAFLDEEMRRAYCFFT